MKADKKSNIITNKVIDTNKEWNAKIEKDLHTFTNKTINNNKSQNFRIN